MQLQNKTGFLIQWDVPGWRGIPENREIRTPAVLRPAPPHAPPPKISLCFQGNLKSAWHSAAPRNARQGTLVRCRRAVYPRKVTAGQRSLLICRLVARARPPQVSFSSWWGDPITTPQSPSVQLLRTLPSSTQTRFPTSISFIPESWLPVTV